MSPIVFRGLIDQTNSQALLPLELWSDQFGQCNDDFSRRPLFLYGKKTTSSGCNCDNRGNTLTAGGVLTAEALFYANKVSFDLPFLYFFAYSGTFS
jgi:hypothetical protein